MRQRVFIGRTMVSFIIPFFNTRSDLNFKIINYIKKNVHNPIAKKDKSKIESTIKNYNDYIIDKNLILYLKKTENSYQGKNVGKHFKNYFNFFNLFVCNL